MVVKKLVGNVGEAIRKKKKQGKHALGVAKAARKVVKTMSNPKNQAKMIVKAAAGGGLVYPGSNYIGPGNPLKGQKEMSNADRLAHKHDREYGALLKKGIKKRKLYGGYSQADERLYRAADPTTEHGLVAKAGMGLKRLGWKAGISGKKTMDKDYNHNHKKV